jgi:hypothetical protein
LGAWVRPIIIVLTVSIYDISGPDERQLVAAKELAEDLLTVVREEHAKAIASMTQNMGGYGGGYQQGGQQGYGQGGYGGYAGGYAVSIILSLYLIDMLISSRLDNSSSRDTMERILARHSNSLLCGLPDKTDTSGVYEQYKGYWGEIGDGLQRCFTGHSANCNRFLSISTNGIRCGGCCV